MISVHQLRAGVAGTRGVGSGVEWSAAQWERMWGVLTAREQQVVYLHVVEDLSHAQIAQRIGVQRETVGSAWRRAIDRLRDLVPSMH